MKTKIAAALAIALFSSAGANANILDKTNVKFSGYIKADAMFSSYSDGTLGSATLAEISMYLA